ncbi:NAD(P)-dependent oxidoreductase [Paenibacillus cremeus]|uniref:NAD(P)-dependent oxidoreductase n=2 Tax=Paenibacillus cremeus TaxID=2163881 RepID=A0A559KGG3_9BACL|nr:NAD(P)-dependent oxidoreductase [Paenibacillus cremeus]
MNRIRHVAFLGLGAMGLPMAKNVLRAGYTLHITMHRNPAPVEELRALGAVVHPTAAEAVAISEATVSILPEDRQMREVLLSSAMLEAVRKEQLLIEMTSGSPNVMKEVAEAYTKRGARVLDAPVSGGTIGAEQGTLTVMAGGEASDLAEAEPLLRSMAATVSPVGDVGAGKAVKAINQMLAAIHLLAASEAVVLAEQLGVDLDALQKVIGSSSGGSWMVANKLNAIAGRQFKPGFRMNLMKKDVGIALAEGQGKPMPIASLAYQLYEMAAREDGDLDFAAVSRLIR